MCLAGGGTGLCGAELFLFFLFFVMLISRAIMTKKVRNKDYTKDLDAYDELGGLFPNREASAHLAKTLQTTRDNIISLPLLFPW